MGGGRRGGGDGDGSRLCCREDKPEIIRTDIKTTFLGGTVMARVRHPKPLPVPVCQAPQVSYLCKTLLHIYCMLIWLPLAPPRARASTGCLTLRRIEPPLLAAILGPQPSA